MRFKRLAPSFYSRSTVEIAQNLLGKILVRKINRKVLAGKIVETEAYLPEGDFASHSSVGLTKRNAPMFENAGTGYVYFIYGVHFCFNVVTEKKGTGAAVLIRAIEPIAGIEEMIKNRDSGNVKSLTNGPAKICQAFKIGPEQNGIDLKTSKELFIAEGNGSLCETGKSRRIGITKSVEHELRFFIQGSDYLSRG